MNGDSGRRTPRRFSADPGPVLVAAALLVFSPGASALLCQSNANANWNVAGTWSCGRIPQNVDDVVIRNGNDVTIPAGYAAVAQSMTIQQVNGTGRVIHAAGTSSLTVGAGGVTVNASNNNNINSWQINAGTAVVNGNVLLNEGANNSRRAYIELTTGSLTVNGTLTMSNASGNVRTQIIATGAATISVTGSFLLTSGLGTLTPGTSTFNYTSASAGTVATGGAISYNNLNINKSGGTATASANGALAVGGNLNVQAGTFDITGINATVSGTTGVTGALDLSSGAGTKIFAGLVTINGGGAWSSSGNSAVTLRGGLTNNGNFTSGTGAYTFDTNAGQQITSATPITFSGDVTVNATVTNNATCTIVGNLTGSSTFTNAANQTLNIGGNATVATLAASASGNTVNYNGGAAQTAAAGSYYHLTVSSAGTVTLGGDISVAGDLTDNGNFAPATGNRTVTFDGTGAQNLLGTAADTSFYRVTMNNTAAAASQKLTIGHDLTVVNLLTLSNGRIASTGSARTIIPSGSSISGASSSSFVSGRLQMDIPNGNPVVDFPVGTEGAAPPALAYSPASLNFTGVSAGGGLLVYAVQGDHPQIATSTLDAAKSVNRYWVVTDVGVSGTAVNMTGTTFSPTFTFLAADVDAGANTANFEIERYLGGAWFNTTPGTRAATSTQALSVTLLGEFAIAEKGAGGAPGGGFNVFETTTVAGSTSGVIRTKIAGANFNLAVVSLNPGGTIDTSYNKTVRVELLDASDNSGALDAEGCRSTWTTVIATLAPDPAFSPSDNGRITVGPFNVANAYPDVRARVTNVTGVARRGCSSDNFAIRPNAFAAFSVSDTNRTTAGVTRTLNNAVFGPSPDVVHNAGQPFSVRATAVNAAAATTTNYTGAPTASVTACAGAACTATFGTLTLNTTTVGGQIASDTASYSEVGAFRLELVDSAFAAVDNADGSTALEREIRSGPVDVGRFVPDHFGVVTSPPVASFATACAGGAFTYVGQKFGYAVQPVITVSAQDAANNPTTLYTGAWWRLTNASVTGKSYTAAAGSLDVSGAPGVDPVIVDAGLGAGTLTFSSGTGFFFTRTTPVVPFNADIALAINVIDIDGVAPTANPVTFGAATPGNGISFSSGKEMRFGQLRLAGGNGSNLVPLALRMEAQYWMAPGYFVTNTADGCTVVATANVGLGNFQAGLVSGDTAASVAPGPLSGGIKSVVLSAPGAGKSGSVDVVLNLATPPGAFNSCVTFGTPPAPGGADLAFLRGQWCTPPAGYDRDPAARGRFGAYRGSSEFIYFRENY